MTHERRVNLNSSVDSLIYHQSYKLQ
jgi:hypothetical protein